MDLNSGNLSSFPGNQYPHDLERVISSLSNFLVQKDELNQTNSMTPSSSKSFMTLGPGVSLSS